MYNKLFNRKIYIISFQLKKITFSSPLRPITRDSSRFVWAHSNGNYELFNDV